MSAVLGAKKTILIVDDAHENISIIKAILIHDYILKGSTSGSQALRIIQVEPPDLILLDVIMPEMDGYEVCRRLKSSEATCDIPVIFITAKNQTEYETLGMEMGAADYIAKPIKPPVLRARVRTQIMLADALRLLTVQNKALIRAAALRVDDEMSTQQINVATENVVIGVPQLLIVIPQLQALREIIWHNNCEAEDVLARIMADISDVTLLESLISLSNRLQQYDFDAAIVRIDSILDHVTRSLSGDI